MYINGEYWRIFLVSADHPMLERSSGGFALGSCDDNLKSIFIYEGLSYRKMRKVLCHEIAHAAMFSYNVELSIEQEELLADLMATYGRQIICETNKIFKRLKNDI